VSNYTGNQYTEDKNNAWYMVFNLIKDKEKILDIGCSSGNLGAELVKRKKCVVDGIDIDAKDVELAKKKLRNAYVVDIERDEFTMLDKQYDAVLMMDVIEHLIDPVAALKKIGKLLKPKGRLIFSVPNMAHVSVRLDLLLGEFQYRQVGLLDHTHLHFYTEETLLKVLKSAGFSAKQAESSTMDYSEKLLKLKLGEAGLKPTPEFIKKLADTKGNIYQFVGVATQAASTAKPLKFPAANPHEVHFKQIESHYDQIISQLKEELVLKDQHIANIQAELSNIRSSKTYKLTQKATSARKKISSRATGKKS